MVYRRPVANQVFRHELEIKRSKFYTFISRAETEAEAREFIAELKSRYPDARHHCSAFIIHVDDAHPIERSNDDGEPSGTAGTPMLDVLRGSGLEDVVAVVVRYFGGIKLGAGGLVHAYSDATAAGIAEVAAVTRTQKNLYHLHLPHADAGRVEAELRSRKIAIPNVNYGVDAQLTLAVLPEHAAELAATVAALTGGTGELLAAGKAWVE